ncbi:hypothetical protein [Fusobacterium sp.]|uniref:hypothetical protein n=1 Tax=Fusobacterium sp. TaxID=68766 RepID=UPI00396C965E
MKNKKIIAVTALIISSAFFFNGISSLKLYNKIKNANLKVEKKDFEKGREEYNSILKTSPIEEIKNNILKSFYQEKKYDDVVEIQYKNGFLKGNSYTYLGLQSKEKQKELLDKALNEYKEAMKESQDINIKKNYEIVLNMLNNQQNKDNDQKDKQDNQQNKDNDQKDKQDNQQNKDNKQKDKQNNQQNKDNDQKDKQDNQQNKDNDQKDKQDNQQNKDNDQKDKQDNQQNKDNDQKDKQDNQQNKDNDQKDKQDNQQNKDNDQKDKQDNHQNKDNDQKDKQNNQQNKDNDQKDKQNKDKSESAPPSQMTTQKLSEEDMKKAEIKAILKRLEGNEKQSFKNNERFIDISDDNNSNKW